MQISPHQETKLTPKANTHRVHNFTAVRADRLHKAGGELITFIRYNITFNTTDIPSTINTHNYKWSRYTLTTLNISQLQTCIYLLETAHPCTTKQLTRTYNTAYSTSRTYHTRTLMTTVSNTLYNRTLWTTQHALSSDHLPIITTINIRHDYRLQHNRQTFTNYKKADWTQFTEDTESAFAQTTIPTNIHTANRIFPNIILMADNQNIPKGKMHSNCRLLPEDIVCKITQRNNIRRANTCDPALKLLNEEITSDIQKYKQNIWKEHLDAHWDQRHNTHTKHIHNI